MHDPQSQLVSTANTGGNSPMLFGGGKGGLKEERVMRIWYRGIGRRPLWDSHDVAGGKESSNR